MPSPASCVVRFVCAVAGACGIATAQSDPSGFGTVYNIGDVPPGSIFDIPTAVTGSEVGDGNSTEGEAFITPAFLGGDTLGSDSQLNLLDGGRILRSFTVGPEDGTGANIEVNVLAGGVVDLGFRALDGSTINIAGGFVNDAFFAGPGSRVNVVDGVVGDGFTAGRGSIVKISGGAVGFNFPSVTGPIFASTGSTLSISGGEVGVCGAFPGSTVTLSGGTVHGFEFSPGSTLHMSGGSVVTIVNASAGSTLDVRGTEFFLDGAAMTELVPGEAFVVVDRDVALSGTLADGSAFSLDLNSVLTFVADYVDPDAVLKVTLEPPVTACDAADVNDDGVLTFGDVTAFITAFNGGCP